MIKLSNLQSIRINSNNKDAAYNLAVSCNSKVANFDYNDW